MVVARNEPVYLEPKPMKGNDKSKCFSVERPLLIETVKGQKIKLTIKPLYTLKKNKGNFEFPKKAILGYVVGNEKSIFNVSSSDDLFEVYSEKIKITHITKTIETKDHRLNMYFTQLKNEFDFLIGVEGINP